ncbi:MAG: hypothetical protein ACYTJ0_19180, partial [Planctomycetota bacterium]
KYKMDDIGGPFSMTFDGDATSTTDETVVVTVADDGTATSSTPGVVEVLKPGEEAILTLPFPLTDTSTITFGGAIDATVNVADKLRGSIGKFKIQIDFDPTRLPLAAATLPQVVDVYVHIGLAGYPGSFNVTVPELEIKDNEWKWDD